MKEKLPEILFNTKINDVRIGLSDIHLCTKDEIEEAQIGYKFDKEGNKIEDWIGEEYIVIGFDSCCGDPIIAKIDDEKMPIYSMFHDDWKYFLEVTGTFEQYISLLEKVSKTQLKDKNSCEKILEEIKKQLSENAYDYWDVLIKGAYEFLTDEEY